MSEPLTGYNAWGGIPADDQAEFLKIVLNIKQNQNSKNVKIDVFRSQIQILINFIDKDMSTRANKCMVLGISFIGPYMCTNTKILGAVIGRSKASINNSLKDLGYNAIKNESIRLSILQLTIPYVTGPQVKQWSVRATLNEAPVFQTIFVNQYMPQLLPSYFQPGKKVPEPQAGTEQSTEQYYQEPSFDGQFGDDEWYNNF